MDYFFNVYLCSSVQFDCADPLHKLLSGVFPSFEEVLTLTEPVSSLFGSTYRIVSAPPAFSPDAASCSFDIRAFPQ